MCVCMHVHSFLCLPQHQQIIAILVFGDKTPSCQDGGLAWEAGHGVLGSDLV